MGIVILMLLTQVACASQNRAEETSPRQPSSEGSMLAPNASQEAERHSEDSVVRNFKLARFSATEMHEDGWCFFFRRETHLNAEGDVDELGIYVFGGLNLRYFFNSDYVLTAKRSTGEKEYIEKYALGYLLFGSGSTKQRHDMDFLQKFLFEEQRSLEEMMNLTEAALDFQELDPNLFLRLEKKCLSSPLHPVTEKMNYLNLPQPGIMVEPYYLDGYKFQFAYVSCNGYLDELYIDVRYETGDGFADYVQLSDLVEKGQSNAQQNEVWQTLQNIREGIQGTDNLLKDYDKYHTQKIGDIDFERLYDMLKEIDAGHYEAYLPNIEILDIQEISQE